MKKKKILVYLYRNFSLRYLIDTNLLENLSKQFEIILLTKENYANYYKKKINNQIKIISYDWEKFEKIRKNSFFSRFFILIRKLSSGKKKKFNNTIKKIKKQNKNKLKK